MGGSAMSQHAYVITERATAGGGQASGPSGHREPAAGGATVLEHRARADRVIPAPDANGRQLHPAGLSPGHGQGSATETVAPALHLSNPAALLMEGVVRELAGGVILWSGTGEELRLNPAMRRLLHHTHASGCIRAVGDALQAGFFDGDILRRELAFLATPTTQHRSIEASCRETLHVYRISTGPLLDAAGGLAGRIQVYQDITPERQEQVRAAIMARAGLEVVEAPDLGAVLRSLGAMLSLRPAIEWMWLYIPGVSGWELAADWVKPGLPAVHWVGAADDPTQSLARMTGVARGEAGGGPVAWTQVPLVHRGSLVGYWRLASRQCDAFTDGSASVLGSMAAFLACAAKAFTVHRQADVWYESTVQALAAVVDARDRYTMHHSRNVSRYAAAIARVMGLPQEESRRIIHAGLVHDIGKVGIPDRILQKHGRLDVAEGAVMITHAAAGAAILERSGALRELAVLVRHHHEWHNGGGYPDSLSGDDVPLGSAVLAVADAFDAMTSYRVYRPAQSLGRAMAELVRCSGEQFHPRVVEACAEAVRRGRADGEPWVAELEDRPEVTPWAWTAGHTLAQAGIHPPASRELVVFLRLAEEMQHTTCIGELGAHVLRVLDDELGYDHAGILLADARVPELVMVASTGKLGALGLRVPRDAGLAWSVMEDGLAQSVPDVTVDARCRAPVWPQGSQVCVPVVLCGRRLGVLLVAKYETGAFQPGEVRLLKAVAAHLAGAIGMMRPALEASLATSSPLGPAVAAEAAGAPGIG